MPDNQQIVQSIPLQITIFLTGDTTSSPGADSRVLVEAMARAFLAHVRKLRWVTAIQGLDVREVPHRPVSDKAH